MKTLESVPANQIDKVNELYIAGGPVLKGTINPDPAVLPGTSNQAENLKKTPEMEADEIIRNAERSKAHMYGVAGNDNNFCDYEVDERVNTLSVVAMDQDYQMIDAHLDEVLKRKILNFEYVEFNKLLAKHRTLKEDEGYQRLEIVNRNGQSFLSPVSECDALQINSYHRWEQAFCIFSNVLTSKYPAKGPELLQYNHMIHSASLSYVWDNVYSYDREFRHHIERHPQRPWNILLQQAWTMLLKDR